MAAVKTMAMEIQEKEYFQLMSEAEWQQYCEFIQDELQLRFGHGLHANVEYQRFLNKNS